MAEEKKPFVRQEGDEVTFNLAGLRQAAKTGKSVLGVILEDVETAARRIGDYAEGFVDRVEERMKVINCAGCGKAMTKDAEGPGYTCPDCGATFTPKPEGHPFGSGLTD